LIRGKLKRICHESALENFFRPARRTETIAQAKVIKGGGKARVDNQIDDFLLGVAG